MRRLRMKIVVASLFLVGAVFTTGLARAWEPGCEDTNPNASYEPAPKQGVWVFVPTVYRTKSADGKAVLVACGYFPKPNPIAPRH